MDGPWIEQHLTISDARDHRRVAQAQASGERFRPVRVIK
jgi:hypothetical protein